MKKSARFFTALCALACLPSLAAAQSGAGASNKPAVGIAVKASTLGIGFDAAVRVHSKVNIRGTFNFLSLSRDFDDTDNNIVYNGNLKLRSAVASVDWYPFGGGFRLSPILIVSNGNKVSLASTIPAGKKIDIDDTEYQSSSSNPIKAAGEVSFKNARPGLTLGFGNIAGKRRVTVPFEIGVIFAGAPVAKLSFTGTACQSNGQNCRDIATDATIQKDVRDAEINLNNDVKVLRFYPVLSLGLSFRF